jgi:ATP-dependent DNA helicase RecG
MRSKRRQGRFTPSTERALYKDQQFNGRFIDRTDLLDAIRGGEDSYLEFKVRFSNPERIAAGICALANSGGGTMVFGVTDQLRIEGVSNPELLAQDLLAICREQLVPPVWPRIDKVAFDSGLRVVVLEIGARRAPHRTADGRFFLRVGAAKREATAEEIAELYRGRTGARAFEDIPINGETADIDEGLLWSFARAMKGGTGYERNGYPTEALLADMRLAVPFGDALVPTVAGLLLFGRSEAVDLILGQSAVVLRRVSGVRSEDPLVEEARVGGNVGSLHDRIRSFVERYADLCEGRVPKRPTGPVAPRPALPRGPVLESIANALVHRDYAQNAPTRVTLFDDRLEVANPAPDAKLTRRSVELGVKEATNPRLKGLFLDPSYGASAVSNGIPSLLRAVAEFTRRDSPRVSITSDTFRVEIPGA